jgi:hypothetical protein
MRVMLAEVCVLGHTDVIFAAVAGLDPGHFVLSSADPFLNFTTGLGATWVGSIVMERDREQATSFYCAMARAYIVL